MSVSNCKHNEKCYYVKRTPQYYMDQMKHIEKELVRFIDIYGLDSTKLVTNPAALHDIITRVDMREDYFIYFHNGTKINEFKRISLLAFWINKLRPFTYMEEVEDKIPTAAKINERFATFLIMGTVTRFSPNALQSPYIKAMIKELTYALRFRDISKEGLMMVLEPLHLLVLRDRGADC
ncbi:MAG: hypothetical protein K2M17_02755 [Bacilli bacterium]|nr:hypothetical protein [Bacilli bacterium]